MSLGRSGPAAKSRLRGRDDGEHGVAGVGVKRGRGKGLGPEMGVMERERMKEAGVVEGRLLPRDLDVLVDDTILRFFPVFCGGKDLKAFGYGIGRCGFIRASCFFWGSLNLFSQFL